MISNINNWFNFFTPKNKRAKTLEDNDIIAFGRKDERSFNNYQPLGIVAKDFKDYISKGIPTGGGDIEDLEIKLRTHPVSQEQQYYKVTEDVAKEYWQKGANMLFTANVPHIKLDNGHLAAMYYVQFIMPDGTLVFEAYDIEEDHNPETGNNGYWIAMKDVDGVLTKVSQLEMTDVFWDYWYDWTLKMDDNQVALIWSGSIFNNTRALQSSKVVIKYSDAGGLEVVESVFSNYHGRTVGSVLAQFYEIGGSYTTQRAEPEYTSDNSYYGMINGEDTGWVFFSRQGDYRNIAGFNLLTFQVQKFEIGIDTPNPTNILGPLFSQDYFSLGKGLTLLVANPGDLDNYTDAALTGLWVTKGETVTWLRSRWPAYLYLQYNHYEAAIDFNTRYGFSSDGYFYDAQVHNDGRVDNGQIMRIYRHKLGVDETPELSIVMLPSFHTPSTFGSLDAWTGGFLLVAFPTDNGMAFVPWYDYRSDASLGHLTMVVWTNGMTEGKVIQSSSSYPSEFTGDAIISKDIINLAARMNLLYPVLKETYKDFKF